MLCGPHCSQLSTILNNIVTPDSGSTILFNTVKQQAHNFYACSTGLDYLFYTVFQLQYTIIYT